MEEAFVFQIPLVTSISPEIRYASRRIHPRGLCETGSSYLLDMSEAPTRRLDTTFDNAILYLHQNTIDEMTRDRCRKGTTRLAQKGFGQRDPVMHRLAQAWLPLLDNPAAASRLFVDYLALALHEHVIATYGQQPLPERRRAATLVPWQLRRIEDFLEANLARNTSIAELAGECGLSPGYFAEIFRNTTGMTPHRWLLKRRVERAKALLRNTDASLALIGLECGFFDQSHFSRVFTRLEQCSPSEWRRYHRHR